MWLCYGKGTCGSREKRGRPWSRWWVPVRSCRLGLGGLSGVGSKKKEKVVGLFVVSYISPRSPGELKSFVLDTSWNNRDLHNIRFANDARKKAEKVEKSALVLDFLAQKRVGDAVNDDGSITL